MSTLKKGDAFEKRVFNILNAMIDNGQFIVAKDLCKIYEKKKYFSKDRNSFIIVDISIECFFPGSIEPSLFFIVECKDYGKPIPVDDIEEFDSKVRQITGANVKALFVTTNNLQSSAFNIATSRKIGVIRLFPDDKINWLIHRTSNELKTSKSNVDFLRVMNALSNDNFVNTSNAWALGMDDYKVYTHLFAMINEMCSQEL